MHRKQTCEQNSHTTQISMILKFQYHAGMSNSVDPQDSVDPSDFQISVDRQYPVDISAAGISVDSSKFSRH